MVRGAVLGVGFVDINALQKEIWIYTESPDMQGYIKKCFSR